MSEQHQSAVSRSAIVRKRFSVTFLLAAGLLVGLWAVTGGPSAAVAATPGQVEQRGPGAMMTGTMPMTGTTPTMSGQMGAGPMMGRGADMRMTGHMLAMMGHMAMMMGEMQGTMDAACPPSSVVPVMGAMPMSGTAQMMGQMPMGNMMAMMGQMQAMMGGTMPMTGTMPMMGGAMPMMGAMPMTGTMPMGDMMPMMGGMMGQMHAMMGQMQQQMTDCMQRQSTPAGDDAGDDADSDDAAGGDSGAAMDDGGAAATQTVQAGAVTAQATARNLADAAPTVLEFEVVLDTHSVDLPADLGAVAMLRIGAAEVEADSWEGEEGASSHHVKGLLRFTLGDAGRAALDTTNTVSLELALPNDEPAVLIWERGR